MNFKPEDFENVGVWHSGGGVWIEQATHKATGLGVSLTEECLGITQIKDGYFEYEDDLAVICGDGERICPANTAFVKETGFCDASRAELYKQASELAESVCEDICDAWAVDVDGTIGLANPTTALRFTYGKDKSDGAGWPLRN